MEHYKILEHKAAGHDGTLTDHDGLLVFKPLNNQELQFYQQIQIKSQQLQNDNDDEDEDIPLHVWMPTFLGVLNEGKQTSINNTDQNVTILPDDSDAHLETIQNPKSSDFKGKDYIVLENLLAGFNKPNIMDIKLGKILYDENASEEKKLRLKQVSETTTSGSLGFRICGMQLQKGAKVKFNPEHIESRLDQTNNTEYIFVNKLFGRTRTPENIKDAIATFFANNNLTPIRRNLLLGVFLTRLQLFYNTLLNEEVRMISSSLLFIFEGDEKRWDEKNDQDDVVNNVFLEEGSDDEDEDDEDGNSKRYPLSSMTLIDFAHSKLTPGQGYDENVIEGVESLLDIFTSLNHQS